MTKQNNKKDIQSVIDMITCMIAYICSEEDECTAHSQNMKLVKIKKYTAISIRNQEKLWVEVHEDNLLAAITIN